MYHRLFVLCRFLLELWSSRVVNKTCSQHRGSNSGVEEKYPLCDFGQAVLKSELLLRPLAKQFEEISNEPTLFLY